MKPDSIPCEDARAVATAAGAPEGWRGNLTITISYKEPKQLRSYSYSLPVVLK